MDTQETYDVTSTEDMNASLIIPQKTKEKKTETITPIKPVVSFCFSEGYLIYIFIALLKYTLIFQPILKSSPGGARNPFKKQQEATKNVQSPLSLTERTLVEVHSTHDPSENEDVSSEPTKISTIISVRG